MPIRIFVIDDEPLIGQLLAYQLSGAGYEVLTEQDGYKALSRFALVAPDLVLLDVMMPNINGWDVCRQIRSASNVPIIMLTAKQGDSDVITGLTSGADDYIGKPFSMGQLLARVEAVLRRSTPHSGELRRPMVAPPAFATSAQRAPAVILPPPIAPPEESPPTTEPPRLGPHLAALRQSRGMSLHQAERVCAVRWEFLQAIETEQFNFVPRAELRQALNSYATFLGVDLRPYLQPRRKAARQPLPFSVAISALLLIAVLLAAVSWYVL
ncbi:response regulator [Candidatus Gracilibacteria bacterium]|nr:response regulator [Candidatus Gracilibacteria bacterium]